MTPQRSRSSLRALLFCFAALFTGGTPLELRAQASDAGTDADADPDSDPDAAVPDAGAAPPVAPVLEPPQLLTTADAAYPADARAQGLGAVVPLRLSINEQGAVTDAEVLEPQGHGFDEAARDAALRFTFSPARKDGVAMPSRIVYRYTFEIAPPPTPPLAPALPGAPAPVAPVAPPNAHEPVDVTLQGRVNEAARKQRSAEAVDVIDTQAMRARAVDVGDVLARTEGIVVRRYGGLGSEARFMLDGLDEERIRFYVDGVPMELSGYLVGPQNVDVDLVDRIEIYRGVVPIRFGADTLGGALNFVTDETLASAARASYQTGAFNTHRAALTGRYFLPAQHLMVRGVANLDYSDNDYPIDVKIADAVGHPHPATVDRFHDAYLGYLSSLEAGVVDAPWIKRLALRVYGSAYDKELQHNIVMSVPYGDARYGGNSYGATLRLVHEDLIAEHTQLDAVFNIARTTTEFVDVGTWVYNWRGERVRERSRPGEVGDQPTDVIQWQTGTYSRVGFRWTPLPEHTLQLSTAQEFATRTGDDRLQTVGRDPEQADRDYFTMVSGVEWESQHWSKRVQNQLFAKHYWLKTNSEEQIPGGIFRRREDDQHRFGFGNGARLFLERWLWLKASYEFAAQLPETYQLFGDGVLVQPNLELKPEQSHNVNIGTYADWKRRGFGHISGNLRAFGRFQDNLILLLGNDRNFKYENVYAVRGLGVVGDVLWSSDRDYVTLNANVTYQQLRNASDKGTFGAFNGDLLPNKPTFIINWGAVLAWPKPLFGTGALSLGWDASYTAWYYRGWESQGDPRFKQRIPNQLISDFYLTYAFEETPYWSLTLEMKNAFDARIFENFGAQRPGRAVFLKLAAEL